MSTQSLGIKLRSLRLAKGLPLRKVAALLDIDVAILSKMERGERKLTKEIVLKLAEVYNHDPEELMIRFLSEKILYEIGDEDMAMEAIQAAESIVEYKKSQFTTSLDEKARQRIIQEFKTFFSSQKLVTKAWLFGSFARRDDNVQSDIDVVIDVPVGKKFTLFDLSEVKENLESLCARKVDVVMLHGLRPQMKSRIEKDMQLLYEA